MCDEDFLAYVTGRLATLPHVRAVALGGSRATGTYGPDSDWDLAVYYRSAFQPDSLRALGWPGEVSELRGWGGGVFNGGAWLSVGDRRVDVHYRDLDDVEHRHTLDYARTAHAEKGHLTDCAGAIATAACQTAHAVMAARGQWVTNEKTLLERAGLRDIDRVFSGLTTRTLTTAIDEAAAFLGTAVDRA
ncbi:MAG: polymerase subunit beta [Pseudonocardiales bacterium]|jgi:predicted nucleotidyltransferase|nr:polymerase subunit beta [Pseudonocardiales bacterium]